MNDSNVQDSGTVAGLLEVGFQAIIKELPFIKEATLVSDKVSSYQNHFTAFIYDWTAETEIFRRTINFSHRP